MIPGETHTVVTYHYGRWVMSDGWAATGNEGGEPREPWFWLSSALPERTVQQACQHARDSIGQDYQVYRCTTTVRLDRLDRVLP